MRSVAVECGDARDRGVADAHAGLLGTRLAWRPGLGRKLLAQPGQLRRVELPVLDAVAGDAARHRQPVLRHQPQRRRSIDAEQCRDVGEADQAALPVAQALQLLAPTTPGGGLDRLALGPALLLGAGGGLREALVLAKGIGDLARKGRMLRRRQDAPGGVEQLCCDEVQRRLRSVGGGAVAGGEDRLQGRRQHGVVGVGIVDQLGGELRVGTADPEPAAALAAIDQARCPALATHLAKGGTHGLDAGMVLAG